MAQIDQNVLTKIANPTNSVQQGFQAQKTHLDNDQRQKDNDMLKVFDLAGDGHTDEAAYYAQSKGLQVPTEVMQNSDFAKGLALSGKFYGNDKAAAQKFTTAWMQSQGQDFDTRMATAQKAAGVPVNEADREYQRKLEFERWKIHNGAYNKKIPSKLEFSQDAFNKVLQYGGGDVDAAKAAYDDAAKRWDAAYGQAAGAGVAPSGASGGLPPVFQQTMDGGTSPGLTLPVNTRKNIDMTLHDGTTPLMASPARVPSHVLSASAPAAQQPKTRPHPQTNVVVENYRVNVQRDSYAQQAYLTALRATGDVDTALQAKQVAYRDYDQQNIPPAAIEYLRKNPQTRDKFDALFGKGSADNFAPKPNSMWQRYVNSIGEYDPIPK